MIRFGIAVALGLSIIAVRGDEARITECPCTGSLNQSWLYPTTNTTGPVIHAATGTCWELVSDGCAWDYHYCIELAYNCNTLWNVTRGVDTTTVTFIVATNLTVGALGLCADFNSDLSLLEVCL